MKCKRILALTVLAALLLGAPVYADGGGESTPAPIALTPTAPASDQGMPGALPKVAEPQMESNEWMNDPSVKVDAAVGVGVPDPPCRNAILVSTDTGEVLYEKEPDAEVPIASITKVMTLLLTLEAVEQGKISMTDIVPISEHAFNMGGSQIWLEPGEQFTLDELIKAICVCSANDAAVAVAEFVGGSEPVFAEMMNQKAAELGMTHTHFVNACGLDAEGHYSSARDVSIMSRELLRHPKILEYSGIWMDSLRGGATQMVNTNKLLKSYAGITGLKTGTTNGAGVCISASAVRDGMGLLAVVLGSPSSAERFVSATEILDYGFANYELAPFPEVAGYTDILPVKGGVVETVGLSYGAPEKLLLKKGTAKTLTATLTLPENVEAPVDLGAQLGAVELKAGDETLGNYPVTAAGSVAEMDFETAMSLLIKALFTL